MPSPLQQPSTRRKLVYLGAIIALFVVNTFLWRGVAFTRRTAPDQTLPAWLSALPQSEEERRADVVRVLPWWTVAAQASRSELTEETQGGADLLGSTVRLALTG